MKIKGALALFLLAMAITGTTLVHGATPVSVKIDADPVTAGIQSSRSTGLSLPFTVAVVVGDVADVEAFNFEVTYDQTKLSSPTIAVGSDLDRNPDANQTALTPRVWSCSPPAPVGDNDPSPTVGAALLSCFSTGAMAGPTFNSSGSVVATVQFTALSAGTSSLNLRNVNVFKTLAAETGSCNLTVVVAATCTGASITATAAPSVGGIAEAPDVAALELGSSSSNGMPRRTLEIAGAMTLIAAILLIVSRRRKNSTRGT